MPARRRFVLKRRTLDYPPAIDIEILAAQLGPDDRLIVRVRSHDERWLLELSRDLRELGLADRSTVVWDPDGAIDFFVVPPTGGPLVAETHSRPEQ